MSLTQREMLKEFADGIKKDMEAGAEDKSKQIYDAKAKSNNISDGTNTGYYDISECKDLDDLSEYLDLRADEFNVLKAIYGIAKARKGSSRHQGTGIERDANKLLHYASRVQKRICNE